MRNLKRVLSLALALVMMLGMMIVGASAASAKDFADSSKIQYTEAVDVLTGLKILEGDDKGSFNPTDVLTREQAAKIICYVIMGPENAEKLGTNTQIFNDVAAGRWSAGYIAYCANLGILAGYGNGNFGPEDQLTGVQFGKLLLVAAGYNAETQGYLGSDWATNIATDMIANKIDVKGVVLSNPLTREQAAQMCLQALDMETVKYTTGNVVGKIGPFDAEQTFAEKYFPKLDKFEGVVTANEYADLYGDKPLKAGKTEIGGKTYNGTTKLTDIGETRRGWANDKDILYIDSKSADGKELNTISVDTGAATKLDSKFEKANGITKDTEKFLNFGQGSSYTCEYLLTYGYVDNKYDNGTAAPAEQVIKAGKPVDTEALRDIFDNNSGYVFVGTKNTQANGEDKSDTMTYREFAKKYLEEDLSAEFDKTVNGDWLKVIDNDNDGEAEYVLKTVFEMNQVASVSKKGDVTLNAWDKTGKKLEEVTIKAADLAASADLAKNDVVITTLIDGITYIDLADSFTGKVDSYSMKNDILTVEGTEYGQSAIENLTTFEDEIANAEKKTNYTFYQDHFGYIRVFSYPAEAEGNYLLLTDGWYNETRTADEYAVKAYLDGEIKDIDVNPKEKDIAGFIDESTSLNNSWGNLVGFNQYDNHGTGANEKQYSGKAITNIAAYTLSDNVLALRDVKTYNYNNKHVETSVKTDYVDLKEVALTKGQSAYDGNYVADKGEVGAYDGSTSTGTAADVTVQATKDTVFYYVTLNNKGTAVKSVKTVTGYKNSVAVDKDNITAAYAVATNTGKDASGNNYWVADVIVVEILKDTVSYEDVFFNVYSAQKSVKDTVSADTILATGKTDELILDISDNYNKYTTTKGYKVPLWFYQKTVADKDGVVDFDQITKDYAEYGIYTAEADRVNKLMTYLTTTPNGKALEYKTDEVTVYGLSATKNDKYGDPIVSAVTEIKDKAVEVEAGDKLIVFCDGKKLDNVVYIINVTKSAALAKQKGQLDTGVEKLYDAIVKDAQHVATPYETAVKNANDALTASPAVKKDLENAKTDLNALTGLTAEQKAYVNELVAKIDAALGKIAGDETLAQAKETAIDNMKAAIWNAITSDADWSGLTNKPTKDEALTDGKIQLGVWNTGKHDTLAEAIETWADEINRAADVAGVNGVVNAHNSNTVYTQAAAAYVDGLKATATTEGYKTLAENKAKDYMGKIKAALADPLTWTTGSTVKALVETKISSVSPDGNAAEYTSTVTAPADVSFTGDHGTKTVDVTVSVTNSYAGVVCDPVVETITVTVTW